MEIIGLPLPLALELLGSTSDSAPTIVETAPPFLPKNRVPVWGEARVLRVRETEGQVELVVARELLAEETPPTSAPQSL
jgi:hypothetical protein